MDYRIAQKSGSGAASVIRVPRVARNADDEDLKMHVSRSGGKSVGMRDDHFRSAQCT